MAASNKPAAEKSREKPPASRGKPLAYGALMARKTWRPLPAFTVLAGNADFFKATVVKRFARELFGESTPEIRRFQGPAGDRLGEELSLATVLDELRTPSFFSPYRMVVIEHANAFLLENGESFLPFMESGFGGGYLLLLLDGKLDGRTRLARIVSEKGWVVDCAQPYDRPPPWEARAPAWDSDLTHWLVSHAREKNLEIDPQTAFLLHEQAGTDLATLDEELEKVSTYVASRGSRKVTEEVISKVVGDLREDSVFMALDLFLEGKRAEALESIERLFRKGYHTEKGALTIEPASIALLFIGAMLPRLRSLRRAHAMAAEGAGADEWLQAGLVQRPFLLRFQRELRAVSPRRILRLFDSLYDIDKAIKTGGDPRSLLEILVVQHGLPG